MAALCSYQTDLPFMSWEQITEDWLILKDAAHMAQWHWQRLFLLSPLPQSCEPISQNHYERTSPPCLLCLLTTSLHSSCLFSIPSPSVLSPFRSKWVSSEVLAGRIHLRANTLLSVVKASPQIPFYTHKCHFPFVCAPAALAKPSQHRALSKTPRAEENGVGKHLPCIPALKNTTIKGTIRWNHQIINSHLHIDKKKWYTRAVFRFQVQSQQSQWMLKILA